MADWGSISRRVRAIAAATAAAGAVFIGASVTAWAGDSGPSLNRANLPVPTGVVNGVACARGSRDCWAAGGTGEGAFVLFSPDGGITWSRRSVPGDWALAGAIACADTGFCMVSVEAAGATGAALLTSGDGGVHWEARPSPTTYAAEALTCPSRSLCLAAGQNPAGSFELYRSTNEGATWATSAAPDTLGQVSFATCVDSIHCWAAGSGILASADGGLTWSLQYPPPQGPGLHPAPPTILGISFVDQHNGWAVGGDMCGGAQVKSCPGYVLHTTDGGLTWKVQESLPQGPFLDSIACSPGRCLVVGSVVGAAEVLSFTGSRTATVVPGTRVSSAAGAGVGGSMARPFCAEWGCLVAGGRAAGTGGFVLTTLPTAAVLPAHRPWPTDLLPTFQEVSWRAQDVARSAVWVLGLLLVIGFPSQLFNSTLVAHYEEVMGWFGWLRRLAARLRLPGAGPTSKRESAPRRNPAWQVVGVFLVGGIFGALLDPKAALDAATTETFVGALIATAITTAAYTAVRALGLHRITGIRGHMRVYWGGLAIAAACLLVSRLTAAQPGYLYGVMLGFTLGQAVDLKRHHEGRLVGLGAAAVLVCSVGTWLLWTPVKAAAAADPTFLLESLSSAMASVFVGGMSSLMFGMLPLRWLDGEKLFAWRRLLWAATMTAGLFLYIHVVLRNAASAPQPSRSLAVTVALFAIFGALSIGLWTYFRLRGRAAAGAELSMIGSSVVAVDAPAAPEAGRTHHPRSQLRR